MTVGAILGLSADLGMAQEGTSQRLDPVQIIDVDDVSEAELTELGLSPVTLVPVASQPPLPRDPSLPEPSIIVGRIDAPEGPVAETTARGSGETHGLPGSDDVFAAAQDIRGVRAWQVFLAQYPDSPLWADAALQLDLALAALLLGSSGPEAYDTAVARMETGRAFPDRVRALAELEETLGLIGDPTVRVRLQAALQREGHYSGQLDAEIGPGTRAAIRRFQAEAGLPITGLVTPALWLGLGLGQIDVLQPRPPEDGVALPFHPMLAQVERDGTLARAGQGAPITARGIYAYREGTLYVALHTPPYRRHDAYEQSARKMGGHLLALSDASEYRWILALAADHPALWDISYPGEGPTIGLVQAGGSEQPAGGWSWTNGDAATFVPWNRGQPDNGNASSGPEYFATLGYDPSREGRRQAGVSDRSTGSASWIVEID